tara:strand:- start:132237 stop:132641 length:405 start_codon:yes stop_codon:yes gene_type:complete
MEEHIIPVEIITHGHLIMIGDKDDIIKKLEKTPVREWEPHVRVDASFRKMLISQIRRREDEEVDVDSSNTGPDNLPNGVLGPDEAASSSEQSGDRQLEQPSGGDLDEDPVVAEDDSGSEQGEQPLGEVRTDSTG